MSEVKEDQIRNNVRENYKKVALKVINNTSCCAPSCCSPEDTSKHFY